MPANLFSRWIKKAFGVRMASGKARRGDRRLRQARHCPLFLEPLETRNLLTAPYVQSIATTAGSFTDPSSINYTVTFNENVTGVDSSGSDFQLNTSGTVNAAVTGVTGSGSVYTVTVGNIIGGGTLALSLVDHGTIQDSMGNKLVPSPSAFPLQSVQTFRADDGSGWPLSAAVADLGDGQPDLVTTWSDGYSDFVSVLRGSGNGTFQSPQIYGGFENTDGGNPDAVVANLNGEPDIIFRDGYRMGVMLNNGNGTFANPRYYVAGHTSQTEPYPFEHPRIAVADLGNSKLDIVGIDQVGGVWVDLGNGDGTFQPGTFFTTGPGTVPVSVAVADLNGDGDLDIVTGNADGTVSVLLGQVDANHNITFGAPTILLVGSTTVPQTRFSLTSVAVADLGNGKADIVAVNNSDNTVSVLLGNGNGTFKAQTTYAVGSLPGAMAVADVDGNGTLDIVTANVGDNSLSMLPGNGNGTFGNQRCLGMVVRPDSIAVANLGNGTGIVTGNQDGTVTVLSNSNNVNFAGQICTIIETPPVLHIAFNDNAFLTNDTANLLLSVSEANSYQASLGFTYVVNWGDDTRTVISSAGISLPVGHIYNHPGLSGLYQVSVSVFDAGGGGNLATALVFVSDQVVQPGDSITFGGGARAGQVAVSVNGASALTFDATDLVYFMGDGGYHAFAVNFGSTLTTPILLIGGGTLTVNGDYGPTNYITKTGNLGGGYVAWGSPVTETVRYLGYKTGFSGITVNAHGTVENVIDDPGADTVINGGPGANTITITATAGNGVAINGGPTTNTYIVDLGNLAGPVSIANSNTSASNSLVVNGAAGDNIISAAGAQVTEGTQTITDTAALTNLTINGGSGSNQITVSALTMPVQNLTLDGSLGSANSLTVSQSVTAPTLITGGSGTNTLTGGGGTTTFIDHGGSNTIVAGTGVNVLVPGGGTDTFRVPSGATSPIIFADRYTVLANGVLNVAAGGVLANDLSPDGNPLKAVLVSSTTHGTLALNADGSFRYTPAANFGGTDSFTYQARSSTGALSIPTTVTIHVAYSFSGFLAPLSSNLAFGLGRTVPIKFQITGSNGAFVNSLSAVVSLQVLNAQGVNVLSSAGGTALRYDTTANQLVVNWSTRGLPAGTYTISLALADGTIHSQTIQLTGSGSGANAQAADGSDVTGDTAGQLLGGEVDLYVDNSNGDLTPDELARIQDAINAVDATIAPYGVTITEVTDPTQADVTLNMDTTSAVGGYAQGILGCYTTTGTIRLLQGWSWYAGSDPTQIGANQYDFQTTVMHELGHALGLGESSLATSAMSGTLTPGTTIRTLTTADLSIPYDEDSTDAQRAIVPPLGGDASEGTAALSAPATLIAASPPANATFAAIGGIGGMLTAPTDLRAAGVIDGFVAENARLLCEDNSSDTHSSALLAMVSEWRQGGPQVQKAFDALLNMGTGSNTSSKGASQRSAVALNAEAYTSAEESLEEDLPASDTADQAEPLDVVAPGEVEISA